MFTNAQMYEKMNSLLMEAAKMNYNIHRLIATELEVMKEEKNVREEAKDLLNTAYGVCSIANPLSPYWNISSGSYDTTANKLAYYEEFFVKDLIGILPADCDLRTLKITDLAKLACTILTLTFGFGPTLNQIELGTAYVEHTPAMNSFDFSIKGNDEATYRVEITNSTVELIVYGGDPYDDDEYDDINATLFYVAAYPEYDESEDYRHGCY